MALINVEGRNNCRCATKRNLCRKVGRLAALLSSSSLLLCSIIIPFLSWLNLLPSLAIAYGYSSVMAISKQGHHTRHQHGHHHQVVLLRHGESTWNKENKYIGWVDCPLTHKGEQEARAAGQLLAENGFEFDVVFTSYLKRAIKTAWLVMDEMNLDYVHEMRDWRLNERMYGDLIGKTPQQAVEVYGADKVELWRGSYDVPPMAMTAQSNEWFNTFRKDRRYRHLLHQPSTSESKCSESETHQDTIDVAVEVEAEMDKIPTTECMRDVEMRAVDFWAEEIQTLIRQGKRILIVGHANNLKALMRHIDDVTDIQKITHLAIPRATPIIYILDDDMKPIDVAVSTSSSTSTSTFTATSALTTSNNSAFTKLPPLSGQVLVHRGDSGRLHDMLESEDLKLKLKKTKKEDRFNLMKLDDREFATTVDPSNDSDDVDVNAL